MDSGTFSELDALPFLLLLKSRMSFVDIGSPSLFYLSSIVLVFDTLFFFSFSFFLFCFLFALDIFKYASFHQMRPIADKRTQTHRSAMPTLTHFKTQLKDVYTSLGLLFPKRVDSDITTN